MRVPPYKLSQHLAQGLSSLYLVFGEEPLQHHEAQDAIRQAALKAGYEFSGDFEPHQTEHWQDLKMALHSQSLFSNHRFFHCRLGEGKWGRGGSEALQDIVTTLPQDVILLCSAGKLDPAMQKTNGFKIIEQKGIIIPVYPMKGQGLLTWISARFKLAGFIASQESIEYLAYLTEGNLLAARGAIEKLSLQYALTTPKPTIELKDLQEGIAADTRYTLFDFVDAVLEGVGARTMKVFSSLKNEGIEPILLLWALTREVRAIIPMYQAFERGKPIAQVLREYKIWQQRLELVGNFLQRIQISQLHDFLIQAKHVDITIKQSPKECAYREIFELARSLMVTQKNNPKKPTSLNSKNPPINASSLGDHYGSL